MRSRLALIAVAASVVFSGCGEREAEDPGFARSFDHLPLAEINDERIESCAAAFHYAVAVAELGGSRIRMNGHLWVLIGGPVPIDHAGPALTLDPTGFERRGALEQQLRATDRDSAHVQIRLNDHEPAETLFRLLDLLEETGHRYWISPPPTDQVDPPNTFKVFVPKTTSDS